jgi:hypothetical protein
MESCAVDTATGHLRCDPTWAEQSMTLEPARAGLGIDALVYFDFIFVFPGAKSETMAASSSARVLSMSSLARFALALASDQIVGGQQSASSSFSAVRSHYQMVRLMSYIFAIGGWTEAGPTDAIDRHLQ